MRSSADSSDTTKKRITHDQMSPKDKTYRPPTLPTGKTIVTAADEDFPFCSDRCRKIDLGKWARASTKSARPSSTPKSWKTSANRRQPPQGPR